MKYIEVVWVHEDPDFPIRLVSELDDERFETRKLEFFGNGRVGYAWAEGSTPDTELGYVAVPPLEEINLEPEFEGVEISNAEFELLWVKHATGN